MYVIFGNINLMVYLISSLCRNFKTLIFRFGFKIQDQISTIRERSFLALPRREKGPSTGQPTAIPVQSRGNSEHGGRSEIIIQANCKKLQVQPKPEPMFSVKTWMFQTEKKGLIFRSFDRIFVDIYKIAFIFIPKLRRSNLLSIIYSCPL